MELLNGSAKSLFVLYLMISSNFLGSLFGCQVQDLMTNNMLLKHLLGFLTLYFFVSLVDPSQYSPLQKLMFTVLIYLCFVLSTKLDSKAWIVFITLLALVYILYIIKDSIQDEDAKKFISASQLTLVCSSILVLILGSIYYLGEKKLEYGKDFSYAKFFAGTPVCRHKTPEMNKSVLEMFNAAFSNSSSLTLKS